jgi:pyrroline-5-carboxylate reductase
MKLCFIGGGTMGEALIKSLLAKGGASPKDITVSDISQKRRDVLKKNYGVNVTASNRESVGKAEVIVLAIKPQEMNTVLPELGKLTAKQVVLSIAAGVTMDTLRRGLKHTLIVRAMPNMPAQIGEGMTVWTASPEVSERQKEQVKSVLAACGEEIYVAAEKYIDMATAVSGSGPAYIFMIIEALTDAGVHIGLPRAIAEKLVLETVIGSARSVKVTAKHPAELKNMVTSPGGTTAEGLLQLEAGGLRPALLLAVSAAFDKAKALGTK